MLSPQVIHSSRSHLDSRKRGSVRSFLIDFSSAFNTIVQFPADWLTSWLSWGLSTPVCAWILTTRLQVHPGWGKYTSRPLTLTTGSPQGCVLSPLPVVPVHMAVWPGPDPTPSSSLRMTQRWWWAWSPVTVLGYGVGLVSGPACSICTQTQTVGRVNRCQINKIRLIITIPSQAFCHSAPLVSTRWR